MPDHVPHPWPGEVLASDQDGKRLTQVEQLDWLKEEIALDDKGRVAFTEAQTLSVKQNRQVQTKWRPPFGERGFEPLPETGGWISKPYIRVRSDQGDVSVWRYVKASGNPYLTTLVRAETVTVTSNGTRMINGRTDGQLPRVGQVFATHALQSATGPLGPLDYIRQIRWSKPILWKSDVIKDEDGSATTLYYPEIVYGVEVLTPGNHPTFKGIRSDKLTDKLNFLSLMLALFGGTASLPHILIRYYTVKDQASARKSTIVGIASIGFFYVLTLYIGLGAMTSGALDVTNSNMAAPLLAKSFGEWLFAIISAIAFTTVLGTVSGLIIAASGAVAHDVCGTLLKMQMTDYQKIRIAKIASVAVGIIAIVLGILFEKMNVSYLVGWAFSVAASANLPSLIMLIFWKGTTKQGITAAITVGLISSLSWILLSADTFKDVYGIDPAKALVPFSQPGIVTIPLGFVVLIVVSLMTPGRTVPPRAFGVMTGR
ncbi:MAG: cation acetate symporter [Planctomycetaceae bacterium]|nr:cation acetate symporter [Planctomycetaceae bacterium]